ncbi:MAG: phenylalanine--tRNA ligase subunit beta [Candidatus Woesearchaeota archaeon]
MPKINLNKKRVLSLIGKNISDKELQEKIPYLGTDLEVITKDEIEVEIFPNRPDLLSEEGFSRALRSFLGISSNTKYEIKKSKEYKVIVEKDVEKVRPYTVCAVIKKADLNEEKLNNLINIQEKLHVTHGRNRSKCAIGIYPMRKIKFPIKYTAKKPSEIKFRTIESDKKLTAKEILETTSKGKEYKKLLKGKEKYPLFIDSNNEILSMPPIINSYETGLVSVEDKELFVECSGTDLETLQKALNMICFSMIDMGFEVYEVEVSYSKEKIITPDFKEEQIKVSKDYINNYLGLNLTEKEIKKNLEKMNIKYEKEVALVPCYRTDILHEIDVVEDVAIGYGYYNISSESQKVFTPGKEDFGEKVKRKLREYLVGLNMIENVSFDIINKELQEKIGHKEITDLMHPVSLEYNSLRKTILVSLLKNLKNNKNSGYPQEIFEFGNVYEKEEKENLGLILTGEFTLTNMLQNLNQIQKSLGIEFELKRLENIYFIEGRSFSINYKGKEVGLVGEIKPEIIDLFELEVAVIGMEIYFDEVVKEISN